MVCGDVVCGIGLLVVWCWLCIDDGVVDVCVCVVDYG